LLCRVTTMLRSPRSLFLAVILVLSVLKLCAQQGGIGSIVGELRLSRGDFPGKVFVELQLRGATIDSTYTDDEGKFGFHSLGSNPYHVVISDEHFYPVDQLVVLDTTISSLSLIQINLTPHTQGKKEPLPNRDPGSNPYLVNPSEYKRHFPKKVISEFDKGVEADADQKSNDAVRHYQKAISLAPDFYPAHNNLGSEYLSKSDFANARSEFERVIELNQSDAAGYFNLSNVWMLSGQLPEAEKYLDEGMRRQPDSALGSFLRGSLDIRLGKLLDAEQSLRRAIELRPTMAQARLQLVNLFLKEGRKQEAVIQLRDFVASFPDGSFTEQAKRLLQRLGDQSPSASSARN
jgi:Tfp pilus assembly protein PilF